MPIVGLNLGKSSFRAVELESKKGGLVLNNFGIFESPALNLESTDEHDLDKFSAAIADFYNEVGFSTPEVVLGLDEVHVFMRIIKMPNMNDKELASALKYEAEQYVPLPMDQVNLSWRRLEPDFTEKDKINIQIVASRKDILEKYVTLARRAKLVPKAIEPETIALGRILGDTSGAPLGTMILDIGFSGSLIVVSYGGAVRFTRAIPIGGDVLTRTIQQQLSLDLPQAEEYKKVYGMDPAQADGRVYDVIKPVIDSLILEVKRADVFFTKHNSFASIKRLVVTGGAALMPNLISYIAQNVEAEVQLANPLSSLEISSKISKHTDLLFEQAPKYSAAIGLAMRGIQ